MHLLSVFSLRNRALIALVTIVIGLFGAIALTSLKQELFPSISLPRVIVTASYPGASPAVVENEVATPIESAIQGIEGLNSTSTSSGSGLGMITASFDYGTDLIYAEQKIQLAINALESQLPEGVSPQVSTFSIGDFPIIQLAVTSDLDPNELTARLEDVAVPELQNLPGVRDAEVSGGAGERVVITPNKDKLGDYHLSTQAIVDALDSAGVLLAVGEIAEEGKELTVQAGARISSLEDIERLPVLGGFTVTQEASAIPGMPPTPTQKDKRLEIGDIAKVELSDNPVESISRVDGRPSLTMAITKTPAGNTVEVSHAVLDSLDELAAKVGSGTEFTVVFNQAPSVERSIQSLTTEGLLGLGFAVLVILVFLLSIRSTLVTAISIPVSVLITFIGVWAAGFSLNTLTLGALTISIGRVVDDSIVVIENIKRHIALGDDKLSAIKTGVREVATAVTASTITTVAVFLPLALVSDITGELFRPFALTVTIALIASLFVSLTIVPVLAYWFLGRKPLGKRASATTEAEHMEGTERDELEHPSRLQKGYLPIVRWTLKHPVVTLLAALVVLGGTGYSAQFLQTNFIGGSGENTLSVTQKIESGSDLAEKDAAATMIEAALLEVPGVETVQLTVGGTSGLAALFGGDTDATFSLTTDPDADQDEIQDRVRAAVEGLEGVGEVTVGGQEASFISNDILIDITAPDEESLNAAAEQVIAATSVLDVTAQATSNLAASQPYISISVDRIEAAKHNLSEVMVGGIVAQAMQPTSSARFELEGRNISIYLADADKPETLDELRGYEFTAPDGDELELVDVATVEIVDGPTAITTERGVRTAEVTVTPDTADIGTAGAAITAAIAEVELPAGSTATVGGVVADQASAFSQLGLALLAAILIVYTIMVATFRSLRQPLLLLISIPFAATGAILLQLASGVPLGAASLIGALMLVGIVVTNAIVLIDLVNQYRERGFSTRDAVEHGASRRLRPILMTAFATIFALLPMAIGVTGQSGFISQPLAIIVIGGLVSSTLLTLIVLPTLYYLVEGAKERRIARRDFKAGRAETDEPVSVAARLAAPVPAGMTQSAPVQSAARGVPPVWPPRAEDAPIS